MWTDVLSLYNSCKKQIYRNLFLIIALIFCLMCLSLSYDFMEKPDEHSLCLPIIYMAVSSLMFCLFARQLKYKLSCYLMMTVFFVAAADLYYEVVIVEAFGGFDTAVCFFLLMASFWFVGIAAWMSTNNKEAFFIKSKEKEECKV